MSNNIFSGLEQLGFNDVSELNIYKKKLKEHEKTEDEKSKSLLYTKTVICPVCDNEFKVLAIKSSAYRAIKKDTDFFIRYSLINPYFYDVWICNKCGYSAMKSDFEKIASRDIDKVKEKITPKWHGRQYPQIYDVNIAIERYKLSLLNYVLTDAKSSKKAITCLKLAWMYRLLDTNEAKETELTFIKEALKGLEDAYYNERFPIYGMDKFTSMYLIGELNRRIGDYDNALVWYSNVITSPGVKSKLKDLARDQKDVIKEELASAKIEAENKEQPPTEDFDVNNKKTGFFSRIFK
jgi:uncharacterized protein (DUF2225 family)